MYGQMELDIHNPDNQYLSIADYILKTGDKKGDRTGTGTYATWGVTARFDLAKEFPILTTKRVYWKSAIREMLWFLTGDTNIRELVKQGVSIWTDWPLDKFRKETNNPNITQEEFEQRIIEDDIFAETWGELGPVYGKQWRRWVGHDGVEIDQIADVIHQLKNNPNSRRIILEGWNVTDLPQMALPPCHKTYQFQVTSDGKLNCLMFQRSSDFCLGIPFNWVGTAALQMMLAHVAGLELGEMVWVGSDVHIYQNHIDQMRLQLTREPKSRPTMKIVNKRNFIDDFKIEDFYLEGYDPHPAIEAPVAV